jgi:hypothetical protein
MEDLSGLIAGFASEPQYAQPLRDSFIKHVKQATARYPNAYFELGQKTPEAVEGLADRSFTVCARVEKGRFPFSARTPFSTFIEERFDDPPIRYHSFYAKLSITRELLRDDYAFNIRRDPVLRWKDDLHRTIGAWLKENASPVDDTKGGHARWTLVATGPSLVRNESVVLAKLKAQPSRELAVLLPKALRLFGQAISHSRLSNWMAEILEAPPSEGPAEDTTLPPIHREIREAVAAAWNALSRNERALIAALARGDDYETLIEKVPGFRDKSSVSRAVKKCGGQFVESIHKAMGIPHQSASATPKEVIERVVEVLLPMLPSLGESEIP